MKQDDRWMEHYTEVMTYMEQHQRRPSKHREDDHQMLNWIKYNKKLIARDKLSAQRVQLFRQLLERADECRHLNQYK